MGQLFRSKKTTGARPQAGLLLLLGRLLLVAEFCCAQRQQNALPAGELVSRPPLRPIQQPSPQQQWVRQSRVVLVPGDEQLFRQAARVDQIILPHENFLPDNQSIGQQPEDFMNSLVIENKRFVEPYSSRCLASTLLEDPDALEPSFVLVRAGSETRLNATAPLAAIQAAGFDAQLHTTLFVHGFTQSYPNTEWLRKVRALFERHHLVARENLIIMDWGAAAQGSYTQVAARASGIGSFLANFLMKLLDLGASRRSIHIIGHSLGAHVAGFAGKRIRPPLGRISALDPAGPCFGKFLSNSANDRLASDDAYEVDVFHYDDSFLGLATPIGHFDVYVNGGSSQPGATDNVNAMLQALITVVFRRNRVLSESHTRSTEVATSDLSASGCHEMAYECRDWPAFLSGECGHCDPDNSQCFLMSFPFQYDNMEPLPLRRTSAPGKLLYIATGPTEVFCLNHFQVLVNFDSAPDLANQARRNRWRLRLELENERREPTNVTIIHQMTPNVFSYLLLTEVQPSRFRSASLQLRNGLDDSPIPLRGADANWAQSPQAYGVVSIEVNFMSHLEARVRQAFSSRLCPRGAQSEPASSSNSIASDANDDGDWLAFELC